MNNLEKKQQFTELYGQYFTDFYKYAYYFMGNATDAEDAVSSALLNAYTYFAGLHSADKFKYWFLSVLKNTCKAKLCERNQFDPMPDTEQTAPSVSDSGLEDSSALHTALAKLKPDDRAIVLLSVLYGYSSQEIGKIIGFTAGNVRVRLHRAIITLQQSLL